MVRFIKILYWRLFGDGWWTHPDVREIRSRLNLDSGPPIVGYEKETWEREREEEAKEGSQRPSAQIGSVLGSCVPAGGFAGTDQKMLDDALEAASQEMKEAKREWEEANRRRRQESRKRISEMFYSSDHQ